MLKKSITYTNPFTEQEVTEEHYFHITKADMVEMEMEEHGAKYTDKEGNELTGMEAKLKRIMDAEDGKTILVTFKDIILRSYGKREENDRFRKSKAIRDDFEASEAFSQLLFELTTDAEKAAEFTNGIIPSNLDQEAAKLVAQTQATAPTQAVADDTGVDFPKDDEATSDRAADIQAATPEHPVTLTHGEAIEMDADEVKNGLISGKYKLS